jgi:hypothetical protein
MFKNRVRKSRLDHYRSRVFTDKNGLFKVQGLIPGQAYRLVFEDAEGSETDRGVDIVPMKAGEALDLGKIKTVMPGESN